MLTPPLAQDRIGIALPADTDFDAYVELGRRLATEERNLRWCIGDWFSIGQQRFAGEAQLELLAEKLSIDAKQLRDAARVSEAFPPAMRSSSLSYEMHRYLAALPEDRRLEALRKAETERWGTKQAKALVTQYRQQTAMFEDEDPERYATLLYRAWNNCPSPEVRAIAYERIRIAARQGYSVINEDEVVDA